MHKRLFTILIACTMLLTAASAADANENPSAAAVDVQQSRETKTFGDFEYEDFDGEIEICKYTGSDSEVTIPSKIDNKPVTFIGERAFYQCKRLTSVTIPNSITSIGDYAFYGCTHLTSVTIPHTVTSIGESAFDGCTHLKSITIPRSVTKIAILKI